MRTIRHVSRKVLAKAERTSTSVSDLIQKLPATVCEDYYFEITRSGSSGQVKTVLKNKPMSIIYFRTARSQGGAAGARAPSPIVCAPSPSLVPHQPRGPHHQFVFMVLGYVELLFCHFLSCI